MITGKRIIKHLHKEDLFIDDETGRAARIIKPAINRAKKEIRDEIIIETVEGSFSIKDIDKEVDFIHA